MYYLSNRTINILAELGDTDCQFIEKHGLKYNFGFISKSCKIECGPIYLTDHFNNKVKNKLRRLNKPTLQDTLIAFPVLR